LEISNFKLKDEFEAIRTMKSPLVKKKFGNITNKLSPG